MIQIDFSQKAVKQIKKLDKEVQKQIKKCKQSLESPNQRQSIKRKFKRLIG